MTTKIRCEWNPKKHHGKACSAHKRAKQLLGVDFDKDLHSDYLDEVLKENKINEKLLYEKLQNYKKTGDVRAIVNGDVGNFNGLTNEDIKELLDDYGFDYEEEGTTILYVPEGAKKDD